MNRKYLVLTLGIAVLIGMLIGPETIKAQLFPEPVYVVNPNNIAAGVMGTSANPMSTTGTFTGSSTPSDAFANPTTAVNTWSLIGAWNGTSWDRLRSAAVASATTGTGLLGTGILGRYNLSAPTFTDGQFGLLQIDANGQLKTTGDTGGVSNADNIGGTTGFPRAQSFLYGYDATTWDRIYTAPGSPTTGAGALSTAPMSIYVASPGTLSTGQYSALLIDDKAVLQTNESSFSAATITTNATTVVKGTSPAWLKRIVVGVAGTTTTATLYNIASAGCTGTPASGLLGTFNTSVNWVIDLDMRFDAGVCIVTAGGTAANLQVVYK